MQAGPYRQRKVLMVRQSSEQIFMSGSHRLTNGHRRRCSTTEGVNNRYDKNR
jgi:hypothetical protein